MKSFVVAAMSPTFFAVGALLLAATATAQQTRPACPPFATHPSCIGQWSGPYELDISCKSAADCHQPPPNQNVAACTDDEIAHGVLIPAGSWTHPTLGSVSLAGKVLVWTQCDRDLFRTDTQWGGYRTHIWDPDDPSLESVFASPISEFVSHNQGPDPDPEDGPFCSSHEWILDDAGNPKLLTVGGTDRDPTESNRLCPTYACGLQKVYWFDPLAADPSVAWSDSPADLVSANPSEAFPVWYPSVLIYPDPDPAIDEFHPMVVGGGGVAGPGCDGPPPGQTPPFQHDSWWTLGSLASAVWDKRSGGDPFGWHMYPRALLTSDGNVLVVGSTIICEDPIPGAELPPVGNGHEWAKNASENNPVHVIDTGTQTRTFGADPNALYDVGGLNYANVVILHTLKDTSVFDPVDPLSNYDLDRVVATGGNKQAVKHDLLPGGAYDLSEPVQTETIEYVNGLWQNKASAPTPRMYGNFVLLPDGTILLVGGRNDGAESPDGFHYVPLRFDPQGPSDQGAWRAMSGRPILGSDPELGDYGTPRGYHHAALLLQDGRVAVMGGDGVGDPLHLVNTEDTVEIFKPPYFFWSNRLDITTADPLSDMHYYEDAATPNLYSVTVNDGSKVTYACLIRIGSVTHHFDYGQRYVALMARRVGTTDVIEVLPPPDPDMAPEGYYLLFVVEVRDANGLGTDFVTLPSKGKFVKLTFP